MSFTLVRAIAFSENNDEIHMARILLLMLAAKNNNSDVIDGITKLAKLDFLIRYPNCLEKALNFVNSESAFVNIKPYERTSIESKMIRFRYGPWDTRYRRWLRILVSKKLIEINMIGKTVCISLTKQGQQIAELFAKESIFFDIYLRSQLAIDAFGNMSSSKIKSFVYLVFPEIITLKWGEDIEL